jgi:hypothetical protein
MDRRRLRSQRDDLVRQFSAPPTTRHDRLAELLADIRRCAGERITQLSAIDLTTATYGLQAAANNLIRLESTFRAASQLIRLGFAFEAEAVIRLGFEQVAWAQAVADATTPEEVAATRVDHTANRLKPLIPDAGRIYNRLSALAHMQPSPHGKFIEVMPGEPLTVGIQLPEATPESMGLMIELLDALLIVSEARFAPYGIVTTSFETSTSSQIPVRPASVLRARLEVLSGTPPDEDLTIDDVIAGL